MRAFAAHRDLRTAPQRAVVAVVTVIGAALRMRQFLANRSFYTDEAYLALNTVGRSFAGLLRPLDWDQSAPLLFLWIEHLSVLLGGVHEQVLRAFPLLAGIALVPAGWLLARRLLPARASLIVLVLLAVSPLLVYYSNEAKPYGVDAFVTVALCLLAVRVLEQPEARARWLALGAGGGLAILLSNPAVFVLAGAGAALLSSADVRRAHGGLRRTLYCTVAWLAIFGIVYLTFVRPAAASPFLQQSLSDRFLGLREPHAARRLAAGVWETFVPVWSGGVTPLPPHLLTVLGGLFLLGMAGLVARRGFAVTCLLIVPLAGAIAASAFGKYPILSRLMTFAAPIIVIGVASGVHELVRLATRAARMSRRAELATLAVAAALVLMLPVADAVSQARTPTMVMHVRPLIREFARRSLPTDPVYITYWGRAQWAFYTTDWSRPDTARLAWLQAAISPRVAGDRVPDSRDDSSFTRPSVRRLELVERLPPGVMMTTALTPAPDVPPAGWAAEQVHRLRQAAHPDAWLFLVHGLVGYRSALLAEVQSAGGAIEYAYREPSGPQLLKIRFPASATSEQRTASSAARRRTR